MILLIRYSVSFVWENNKQGCKEMLELAVC